MKNRIVTSPFPPCDFDFLGKQTKLILSSYRHWKRKELWPDRPDQAQV